MTAAFLSIRNFRKLFGEIVAVDNVSLEIAKGEFLTFLGPSGSGKSTTLYAIAGFDDPSSGDIHLKGASILQTPPHKRNIGMVFQRYTLFPNMTVADNVAFPLRVRNWSDASVKKRVAEMLSLVRLEGFDARMPAQLSGGQQQRVALARALSYDPPVLLMDEPLSALDKKLRDEIQVEIRRIHRETGVTILYVTHDQEEALRLSDRIAVFNKGGIEQVGTGSDLYQNPATRFVAGFVGDSNFLQIASIEDSSGERGNAVLADGTQVRGARLHAQSRISASHELMVRPQALTLGRAKDVAIQVRVMDISYLGESCSALFETRWGQTIWMKGPAHEFRSLTIGANVDVSWNIADADIF